MDPFRERFCLLRIFYPEHFFWGLKKDLQYDDWVLRLNFLVFISKGGNKNTPQKIVLTLPESNSLHLKMDGWKMNFLLGPGLFPEANCYFQGG